MHYYDINSKQSPFKGRNFEKTEISLCTPKQLLVSWGWYFSIFAVLSEMDNISQTFLDLRPRPSALFNFLITQGFFLAPIFPLTLLEEKTPTETSKLSTISYLITAMKSKFKTYIEKQWWLIWCSWLCTVCYYIMCSTCVQHNSIIFAHVQSLSQGRNFGILLDKTKPMWRAKYAPPCINIGSMYLYI